MMIHQFWTAMQSGVGGLNRGQVVTFNDTTHRITVQVGPRHKVWFNKVLAEVLGLTEENTHRELYTGSYVGQEILDLNQGLQSVHVRALRSGGNSVNATAAIPLAVGKT